MKTIRALLVELKNRGIINNITSEEKLLQLRKGDGIYIGFDPTATSLHLGNYAQVVLLKRFEKAGFKTFALLGGATGMIGDPSFKEKERSLLDQTTLEKNKAAIKFQLESFGFQVIDNYDFYAQMNVIDFLRNVGKQINVNYMINKESINTRLETGLSFTEFTYTLLQGYDFLILYEKHKVKIQAGGSDQWGNITTGLELIRKNHGETNALGITVNLLTNTSGQKFGKTVDGAIWIDEAQTSSFALYQFLLNQKDEDVEKLLKWYTYLELDEIDKFMYYHNQKPKQKLAQKMLALYVTQDIHGKTRAHHAKEITEILFESTKPLTELTMEQFELLLRELPVFDNQGQKRQLIDLLVAAKICTSKREGREFLAQGAISVDGQTKTNEFEELFPRHFDYKYFLIKKGKKHFYIVKF